MEKTTQKLRMRHANPATAGGGTEGGVAGTVAESTVPLAVRDMSNDFAAPALLVFLLLVLAFSVWNRLLKIRVKKRTEELSRQIAERDKAQKALKESEQRYRIVADFTYDWEYWLGPEGDFRYVSPSCETFTGYRADEFIGDPGLMAAITHEEDKGKVEAHLGRSDDSKAGEESMDFRIVTREGRIKWINHYSRPVFGADGEYLGKRASNRDITDRKLAEEELRKSEALFRAITEKTKDVTLILDAVGLVKYASPSVNYVLGFPPKRLEGRPFDEILEGEDMARAEKALAAAVENPGRSHPPIEFRMPRDDGSRVRFEGLLTGMLDQPGIEGVAINCRDVTERRKLEKDLGQARKMEVVGKLAGGIAHDFNNILSSLIGFAELALDDVRKGASPDRNLNEIIRSGTRASELVRQILTYSRPSEDVFEPVDIRTVLEEAVGLLKAALPSSIEIRCEIDGRSSVMGNRSQLHQILMNLFTNAAQAMEDDGGLLAVESKEVALEDGLGPGGGYLAPGAYVKVRVSDTGEGICPEIVDSIFEPYFTTRRHGEGMGMGLAVVQSIVEKYRGDIAVQSRPGKGTTFTIHLPAVSERVETPDAEEVEITYGEERILFVDDDPDLCRMTKETLRRMGYEVEIAGDGEQALEVFRAAPDDFDLLISDMTMPKMSGDRLVAEVKRIRPEIPAVICTGYSKKISDRNAEKIGASAVMYKPIIKSRLAQTVRQVLDRARKDP